MSTKLEAILRQLPTDYVNYTDLCHYLPGSQDARYGQIKRSISEGFLISLKKGLYYRGAYLQRQKPHPFEISQRLVWPSYVSLESALAYHGLIPEAIYSTTCVTIHRRSEIQNDFGFFKFEKTSTVPFFLGVDRVQEQNCVFLVASPWKAITDYLYCYKKNFSSMIELSEFLRLEENSMPKLTPEWTVQLSACYRLKRIDRFLKKSLREQ